MDARDNWWGHETGPSSQQATSITDACTDAAADGQGDSIRADDTEVCFAPWLTEPNEDAGAG